MAAGDLFDRLSRKLSSRWRPAPGTPLHGRNFRCTCGKPIFFRNTECLNCRSQLGYVPGLAQVRALVPGADADTWVLADPAAGYGAPFRRCDNFATVAACNWLVAPTEPGPFCISCRLNHTIPDLTIEENGRYWSLIEVAKRRLVSQLLALGLPVRSKVVDDPERGLAFDFLRAGPGGPPVMTGHANGLITINIEEANDAYREKTRLAMREPYRTLLGHLRHEVGHYYWDRLVAGTAWHEPYRRLFGDENADYAAALKRNYDEGPPPDWASRFISAYAASHPWEDWAETWAHYLHIVDSIDTALGFGLDTEDLETQAVPYTREDLYDPSHPDADSFLFFINAWLELTTLLNELSRSMGLPDFYPFVMSRPVLAKLHFIHLVVKAAAARPD